MAWLYLILAGMSEIVWAYGLKATHGFTNLKWSVITIIFMFVSFFLFAKSMKQIPIGTGYAVFTGIGAAGTAIIGIIFLNEGTGFLKMVSLTILILGIVGLKLVKDKKE
ncbi:MAG TPA: ligand-binding protein SH3, partial [Dysgonomonas sp.]|nr:ligand-binding protein SH3 [Dysgonomonas sp.]